MTPKRNGFIKFIYLPFVCLLLSGELFPQGKNNLKWNYSIRYVNASFLNFHEQPSDSGKILGQFEYFDKILIVYKEPLQEMGWLQVVYPVRAFTYSRYLFHEAISFKLLEKENTERSGLAKEDQWYARMAFCDESLSYVKKKPNATSAIIDSVKENESVLLLLKSEKAEWVQVVFPYQGFVNINDFSFDSGESNMSINFLSSYSPINYPFEKNLQKKGETYGGNLEMTFSDWDMTLGVGFNVHESFMKEYFLKTRYFYFYDRIKLYSLTQNLHFHASAGLLFWQSKFQYTKYPVGSTVYYVEEDATGFGFTAGAGLMFNYGNLILNCQYTFFGASEATFGYDPAFGEFSNKYKLFPGSNQLQLMAGFKIDF